MRKSPLFLFVLIVVIAFAQSCTNTKITQQLRPAAGSVTLTPTRLREILQNTIADDSVPGIGAVVFTSTEIVHLDVAGMRNAETGSRLTRSDRFEIGAATEILTAMIAAKLVEQGRISWSSKAEDVLGLRNTLREEYKNVTLNDLLINKIALPEFINKKNIEDAVTFRQGNAIDNRKAFANHLLRSDTVQRAMPQSGRYYNNAAYAVANAMLEKVSGDLWENLCSELINKPLHIDISTIINEKTNTHIFDAASNTWKAEPYDKGATVLMPANGAVADLGDLARLAQEHLRAARGEKTVFGTKSLKFLHTATERSLSYGWAKQIDNKKEIALLSHDTKGRSANILIFYPKRNLGFAIIVNAENTTDYKTSKAVLNLLNRLKTEYIID